LGKVTVGKKKSHEFEKKQWFAAYLENIIWPGRERDVAVNRFYG